MTVGTGPGLKRTPLNDLHLELGARMVEFAGYHMPVHYAAGILEEHLHTRSRASLFDVSHMGQVTLRGEGAAAALEMLVPGDIGALAPGRMRYTLFTNDSGGILDDVIVTNVGPYLFLVVNASRKEADIAHLKSAMPIAVAVDELAERALLALQGPDAARVLSRFAPGVEDMPFMSARPFTIDGSRLAVTRSGYTGEDGFELSVPGQDAVRIASMILEEGEVAPAGLGARDSLRLEAGLCLYGHDIDTTTTPVEAGLGWSIGKRRRTEGGFPGAAVIMSEIENGPARHRVGIVPEGKAPAREGTVVTDENGSRIGEITSGGFGPSLGGPIAMGYVETAYSSVGARVDLIVREKARPAKIVPLPFVAHRYFRKKGNGT